MTKAAEELFMTQPGVSQNIMNLEDMLQIKLFDRVKKKLLPTQKADELYLSCAASFNAIENSLANIIGENVELKGTIRVGLPVEFGNNVVLPKLCDFASKHPGINFNITYDIPQKMNKLLLRGDLDFAIVDSYPFDSSIETHSLGREELLLCMSEKMAKDNNINQFSNLKHLMKLDFVDYDQEAPILNMWFKYHFKNFKTQLRMRAAVMDVQGLAQLVVNNLGAAILPRHMVKKLKQRRLNVFVFDGPGKTLVNELSLALLKNKTLTKEVSETISYLKETIKK
jgi:DNA-binding transcriptional LysR family regulator